VDKILEEDLKNLKELLEKYKKEKKCY